VVINVAFDLELAHGRCVGIRIPDREETMAVLGSALVPEEREFASALGPLRRRTWIAGRAALRQAIARAGFEAKGPVLADDRGAPVLPGGISGSITHKENLAAALVARATGARVGIDVEHDVAGKQDIASRVLAEDELVELAALDAPARAREVLLRFSSKEAIYKALDPFVRRFVGFDEVSVVTEPDGRARVTSRLRGGEGPFAVEVRWRRFDGIVLTTARVSRAAHSVDPDWRAL
jgi:4'-phosphopantetheinyl transferase EntD